MSQPRWEVSSVLDRKHGINEKFRILWSTKEKTWEPGSTIRRDIPLLVKELMKTYTIHILHHRFTKNKYELHVQWTKLGRQNGMAWESEDILIESGFGKDVERYFKSLVVDQIMEYKTDDDDIGLVRVLWEGEKEEMWNGVDLVSEKAESVVRVVKEQWNSSRKKKRMRVSDQVSSQVMHDLMGHASAAGGVGGGDVDFSSVYRKAREYMVEATSLRQQNIQQLYTYLHKSEDAGESLRIYQTLCESLQRFPDDTIHDMAITWKDVESKLRCVVDEVKEDSVRDSTVLEWAFVVRVINADYRKCGDVNKSLLCYVLSSNTKGYASQIGSRLNLLLKSCGELCIHTLMTGHRDNAAKLNDSVQSLLVNLFDLFYQDDVSEFIDRFISMIDRLGDDMAKTKLIDLLYHPQRAVLLNAMLGEVYTKAGVGRDRDGPITIEMFDKLVSGLSVNDLPSDASLILLSQVIQSLYPTTTPAPDAMTTVTALLGLVNHVEPDIKPRLKIAAAIRSVM